MKEIKRIGPWLVEYIPEDGGRISWLSYDNIDLLTVEPKHFTAPKEDYGAYERRPVYGYDDCFPSIEPCYYPGSDWMIPDHGEVCWLPFEVQENGNNLIFQVESKNIPAKLIRKMTFESDKLIWSFRVENKADKALPFQHVVHPLMPLNSISGLSLPEYESIYDDINQINLSLDGYGTLEEFLLSRPAGTTNMLFVRNIKEGKMSWEYHNKIRVTAEFSTELFPSIGIWWNNNKYPDEDNCRRNECALEPVPGLNSRLADAHQSGKALQAEPLSSVNWQIVWHISEI